MYAHIHTHNSFARLPRLAPCQAAAQRDDAESNSRLSISMASELHGAHTHTQSHWHAKHLHVHLLAGAAGRRPRASHTGRQENCWAHMCVCVCVCNGCRVCVLVHIERRAKRLRLNALRAHNVLYTRRTTRLYGENRQHYTFIVPRSSEVLVGL